MWRPAKVWAAVSRVERIYVALLLVGAALTLLFLQLADEMSEGETARFDHALLLAFRHFGDPSLLLGPSWLPEAVRDITALGSGTVLDFLTLATVGYLILARHWRAAAFVLVAVFGGMLLSEALKIGYARPRPDLVPHLARVVSMSFPSGHASQSAIVFLTLGALLTRIEATTRAAKAYFLTLAILLTCLVGTTRVMLGVHYPSDVLAGWCVGAAWASICWIVALSLQRRGAIEQAPVAPQSPHLHTVREDRATGEDHEST